jgi:hypothetical protein
MVGISIPGCDRELATGPRSGFQHAYQEGKMKAKKKGKKRTARRASKLKTSKVRKVSTLKTVGW